MMFSESHGYLTAIETKGISILGWTAAVLALTLGRDFAAQIKHDGIAFDAVVAIGGIAAAVALVASAWCVKTEAWAFPSPKDWLEHSLFAQPSELRIFHLLSLLENYQELGVQMDRKAKALVIAQWAFVVETIALGSTIVVSLFT